MGHWRPVADLGIAGFPDLQGLEIGEVCKGGDVRDTPLRQGQRLKIGQLPQGGDVGQAGVAVVSVDVDLQRAEVGEACQGSKTGDMLIDVEVEVRQAGEAGKRRQRGVACRVGVAVEPQGGQLGEACQGLQTGHIAGDIQIGELREAGETADVQHNVGLIVHGGQPQGLELGEACQGCYVPISGITAGEVQLPELCQVLDPLEAGKAVCLHGERLEGGELGKGGEVFHIAVGIEVEGLELREVRQRGEILNIRIGVKFLGGNLSMIHLKEL